MSRPNCLYVSGSTAAIATTAGVGKTLDFWFYENGGGANVALMRYNGNGTWSVIPASEFSTSSATAEQIAALNTAKTVLSTDTTTLNNLVIAQTNAQTTLTNSQNDLQTQQTTLDSLVVTKNTAQSTVDQNLTNLSNAQQNLTNSQSNLSRNLTNLSNEQQNLTNLQQQAQQNLTNANILADAATVSVQQASNAMANAAQVAKDYYEIGRAHV